MNVVPDALVDLLQLPLKLRPQLLVEGGERLVEQQDVGGEDERAGERHALLLAAGELARIAVGERYQLDEVERAADPVGGVRPRHAAHLQRERDVVEDGEVREQRVALEDHAEVALLGRQVRDARVVDEDVARRGLDEAGDDHEQRGLPRAGWAEQRQELTARHVERHAVHGGDAAVVLGDVAQRQVVSHLSG